MKKRCFFPQLAATREQALLMSVRTLKNLG